jgi:AcrR family transcriptional regulator
MAIPAQAGRVLRADAQRNKDRILEVSEQHFIERGVTTSLEDIARGAGVGVGTLYRHFPTREDLIAGLLTSRQDRLHGQLDNIRASSPDAGAALDRWLSALADWASAFDGLPAPLRDAIEEKSSPLALTCEGYVAITDEFLGAAQREGSARPEKRGRDLFLMVLAASWARAAAMADTDTAEATIDLIRTGWTTAHSD